MHNYIHIVEDDEDIRYIVEFILSDMGYKVMVSETITEFKKHLLTQLPDLLLLDVMLPDGNGLDLCLELKQHTVTSAIPILIMSAHATEAEALRISCAEDFISKPFDLDEMILMIRKYLPLE